MLWCSTVPCLHFGNGSPTFDSHVLRGLFQGDSISTFLFLMVVEGIIDMVHNATTLGELKGFKVNEELNFELLQFVLLMTQLLFVMDLGIICGV